MKAVVKTINDSAFFEVMGRCQNMKIIELFIESREDQLSFTDVVKGANIKKEMVRPLLDKFEKLGLLKITKQIGRTKLYKLDKKNSYSKCFIQLYDRIMKDIDKLN